MRETEITYELFETCEQIVQKLKKLGFVKTDTFELIDRYFSHLSIEAAKSLPYQIMSKIAYF